MYYDGQPKGELDKDELEAARLGFRQLLRCKRFSPHFIDTNAEDLFGTATLEYSRKLAEGEEIYDPPGWLITCAWRRTKSHLEAEGRAPRVVSTERSGPVVDEEGQGPEDVLLDADRFRKVREAVADLSADQRRILALSYFEGLTVREAGRQLRWHSSKAQRAHEGAKRKLHKLLGVSSSDDLAIEVGLAAYLSVAVGKAGASGHLPLVHELLDRTAQKASEGLASLKQHANTAYSRTVDPTPLAAARPGTVASVVVSCIAIGGGAATYCAQEGMDPLGAARGLIASSSDSEAPSEPPAEEEAAGPVYTPAEPPVSEEAPTPEPSPPPAEEVAPEPEPEPEQSPPPPDDAYEPVRPEYMASEEAPTSSESSSEAAPVASSSSPAPVAANAGPQFGGP